MATLRGLTIDNNTAPAGAGVAVVDSNVTIESSSVTNNTADSPAAGGGGVGVISQDVNGHMLSITDTVISSNTTAAEGGGLGAVDVDVVLTDVTVDANTANGGRAGGIGFIGLARTPVLTADRLTISGNQSNADGGGIAVAAAGIDLTNVTVSGNSSTNGSGGGIAYDNNFATVLRRIRYSTIVSNNAPGLGSNIAAQGAAIDLEASIFSGGNGAALPGVFNSLGSNIDSGLSMGFGAAGDLNNTDPLLGVLQDNGGAILTHALLPGSPAIDAGSATLIATDARNIARPTDGNGDTLAVNDIGAFEGEEISLPALSIQELDFKEGFPGSVDITVLLSAATSGPFSVDYSVQDIDTDSNDYGVSTGTLNFTGSAFERQFISLVINDDNIAENPEQFQIVLSNPTTVVDVSSVGTFGIDDDDNVILRVSDVFVSEGSGTATVNVTQVGQRSAPFTVGAQTIEIPGSAIADTDYASATSTLSFSGNDGEVQAFTVNLNDDFVAEAMEQFSVEIVSDHRNVRFDNMLANTGFTLVDVAPPGLVANAVKPFSVDPSTTITYVAADSGLVVFDTSNLSNVTELGAFPLVDRAIEIDDDDLFIRTGVLTLATESGLEILDVSDPTNVVRLGSFPVGGPNVRGLARVGNIVYLAEVDTIGTTGLLRVLDVSDPTNIVQIGSLATPSPINDVDVRLPDTNQLVLATASNLQVVDITDPASPAVLGTTDIAAVVVEYDESGGPQVAVGTATGVTIFDISDVIAISEVVSFTRAGATTDIDFDDGFLIIADDSGTLEAASIGPTGRVSRIAVASLSGSAGGLGFPFLSSHAAVATTTGGFQIFTPIFASVTTVTIRDDDTANLQILDATANEGDGTITFIAELSGQVDTAFTVTAQTTDVTGGATAGQDYVASSQQLSFSGADGQQVSFVVSLTDDMDIESSETFLADVRNVDSQGRAIEVYSTNDALIETDVVSTASVSRGVDVAAGVVYLADGDTGLRIFDRAGTLLGEFDTPGSAFDVDVVGDRAYVADGDMGLRVLDVSDPANVTELGSFANFTRLTREVEVVGDFAYVPSVPDGVIFSQPRMTIFDISDPADIREVGVVDGVDGVAVRGTTAFTTSSPDGFRILDVSNPANVVTLFEDNTVSTGAAITAVAERVYVSTGESVAIYDIRDPSSPILLGGVDLPALSSAYNVTSIEITGDTAFIGTDNGSVSGYEVFDPANAIFLFEAVSSTAVEAIGIDGSRLFVATGDSGLRLIDPASIAVGTIIDNDAAGLDLSIAMSDAPDPVAPGGSLVYTIVVTNLSTVDATNVGVTDVLPAGVTFVSGDVDGDASRVTNFGSIEASIGLLAGGASSTVTLNVTVDANATGTITNVANAITDGVEANVANNTASATTTVTAANSPPTVLAPLTFTFSENDATQSLDLLQGASDADDDTINVINPTVTGDASGVTVSGNTATVNPSAYNALNLGENATIIVSYDIVDGRGGSVAQTATITITGVNDANIPPTVLAPLTFTLSENDAAQTLDLLQGATDADGDTISVVNPTVTGDASGVTVSGNTVAVNPSAYSALNTGENATIVVSYDIADGRGGSVAQTATVIVTGFTQIISTMLSGHVSCDANGNGMEDTGESVVGTTVFLDSNGNRSLDVSERSTLTDSNGDYLFDNVTDSTLTVVAEIPGNCQSVPTNPGIVRSQINVGQLARSITAVDIDGDFDQDLLIANDISNDVAILQNDEGNFTLIRTIPLADRPQSITSFQSSSMASPMISVAAIGTPSDGGAIYTMNGNSSAERIGAGNGPIEVVLDDFDGNGAVDILTTSFRSSELQLLMNVNASDAGVEPVVIATTRQVITVDSGDADNDGDRDLVVAGIGYGSNDSELILMQGDGTGEFADPLQVEGLDRIVSTRIADLTTDLDDLSNRIFALSEGGELLTFAVENGVLVQTGSLMVSSGATSFDFGDFNRDGLTDVAVANLGDELIEVYVGNGSGQFALVTTVQEVAAPADIVVADFNGDLADDIAVANYYQRSSTDPSRLVLPSTATIILVDIAESGVVISNGAVENVDFNFQNADPEIRLDVNGDLRVSSLDALQVINRLSQAEGEAIAAGRSATDVNGDGYTSAVDALMIINRIGQADFDELAAIDLLGDEEDDDEVRVAAVDLVLTNLLN
ncbi:MAG: Calx-beta domain-containing protein [Rubripirellula sp.]